MSIRTTFAPLIIIVIAATFCSAEETPTTDGKLDTSCKTSSDCVAGPEVSACFQYCEGEECQREGIKLCPVYSKKQQIAVSCVVSVTCKKPAEIHCNEGQCNGV